MGKKIFWACFLTIILSVSFVTIWKIEHADHPSESEDKDTQLWMSPLIFPVILAALLIVGIWVLGMKKGILRFLFQAADIFLYLNMYFLVMLILLPFFRRHISARACAALWLVPAFLFYQVSMLNGDSHLPFRIITLPGGLMEAGLFLWFSGFVVVLVFQILSHLLFRRRLLTYSREIQEERVKEIWQEEREGVNYTKPVRLCWCDMIHTPLSMGIGKKSRVTLLPEKPYTDRELSFIFRHELYHLKRCDVETKIFLGVCKAFCWFDPLVWIAMKKASDDLELSCDEIVLRNAGTDERREYAGLLLETAGSSRGYTTCLSAAASSLRYRMRAVLHPGKRYMGVLVIAAAMFISCFLHGTLLLAGQKKPMAEALEHIGITAEDITFMSCDILAADPEETGKGEEESMTKEFCEDELFAYISSIGAEQLYTAREFSSDGRDGLYLYSEDKDAGIFMDDTIMILFSYGQNIEEYYRVCSDINWAYVKDFFAV